jgi:polar amino acid transport system substrate-binding protein
MKRLLGVTIIVAFVAAGVAAWGIAAPSGEAREAGMTASAAKKKKKLPPLPAAVRNRKEWNIGIKCDVPPFGYINVRGENAGFEVEIAKWFSRYAFGRADRVNYICAPTATREPLLTTGRADIVLATFTYTRDRDTRIDFSRPYYKATGRLLVPNNSTLRLRNLAGKTVATTSGSIYDRWIDRCFPNTQALVTDSFSNAVIAFRDGRADTVMWDDTGVLGIATTDRNYRLTPDTFLEAPYGIGIRQGNAAMRRWINSRLELLRKADRFRKMLRNNVPPRLFRTFQSNVLRPKNTFRYAPAGSPTPDTVCP